jgi:hypothetical protein
VSIKRFDAKRAISTSYMFLVKFNVRGRVFLCNNESIDRSGSEVLRGMVSALISHGSLSTDPREQRSMLDTARDPPVLVHVVNETCPVFVNRDADLFAAVVEAIERPGEFDLVAWAPDAAKVMRLRREMDHFGLLQRQDSPVRAQIEGYTAMLRKRGELPFYVARSLAPTAAEWAMLSPSDFVRIEGEDGHSNDRIRYLLYADSESFVFLLANAAQLKIRRQEILLSVTSDDVIGDRAFIIVGAKLFARIVALSNMNASKVPALNVSDRGGKRGASQASGRNDDEDGDDDASSASSNSSESESDGEDDSSSESDGEDGDAEEEPPELPVYVTDAVGENAPHHHTELYHRSQKYGDGADDNV